jgi:hypothetical protein
MNSIRAALSHLTWRSVLVAALLAAAIEARHLLGGWNPASAFTLPRLALVSAILMSESFLVLLAVVGAEEAERHGVKTWCAFIVALLAACCIIALLRAAAPVWVSAAIGPAYDGVIEVWTYGGIAMIAYLHRRSAIRMLEGVRTAELNCVQSERYLIDSRLAAFRAQIDQPAFFAAMTDIRNAYHQHLPDAGERLDALIQQLRDGRDSLRMSPRSAED